jgi:hypothetical protein
MFKHLSALLICLTLSMPLHATDCLRLSNNIYHDINRYPTNIQNQHLVWMQVQWLTGQLGKPSIQKLADNTTEYTWACEDISSDLVAVTDQRNRMISIKGQYNLANGAGMFSKQLSIPNSTIDDVTTSAYKNNKKIEVVYSGTNPKVSSTAPKEHEMVIDLDNITPQDEEDAFKLFSPAFIQDYNKRFNVSISNAKQLKDDIFTRTKAFFANLKQCKAGSYVIAVPMLSTLVITTFTIQGMQSADCIMQSEADIFGQKMTRQCAFSPQTLALFDDAYAETQMNGKDSPADNAIAEECKIYINGQMPQLPKIGE